jgi:hypothetical protein
MVGKNNCNGKFKLAANKIGRFSIRKLSVGAVSVLLGFAFWGISSSTQLQAATPQTQPVTAQESQNGRVQQSAKVVATTGTKTETPQTEELTKSTTNINHTSGNEAAGQPMATLKKTTSQKSDPKAAKEAQNDKDKAQAKYADAQDDTKQDSYTVTRTVNVTNPETGDTKTFKTQFVTITRSVNKDPATGKTTYGNWTSATIPAVSAPEFAGYTVDNPDGAGAIVVNSDQVKDSTVTFTYSANDQSQVVNYVDTNNHSNIVSAQTVTGKTSETVNWTPQVPENWALAPNQTISSTITFGTSEKSPIVLYVEHGEQHILYQTKPITRIVNYIDPTDSTEESIKPVTTQEATIERTGYKNAANGDTVWTNWSKSFFEAVKAKSIDGYTVTNPDAAPKMAVTGDTPPTSTVTFTYTPNEQSFNVNYVDDSTRAVVNTVPVSGETGVTVSFDAQSHVPSGYVIVSGQSILDSLLQAKR